MNHPLDGTCLIVSWSCAFSNPSGAPSRNINIVRKVNMTLNWWWICELNLTIFSSPYSVGNHWEPFWRVCQVCDNSLRPDHILKLESIHEDLGHYLNEIGLGEYAEKFPWSNPNSKSILVPDFYSRLRKTTVQELYHIYKVDHELFDYDPQSFLDLAH